MYDPNSLMYVTKEYENSLKDKVKKIQADDTVTATLNAVNNELDDILTQINSRLDEISNKKDEIDTYRADIHRFIDSTSINTKELIDEDTSSTASFPSFLANKQDRSESRIYNYNNFINQKIELDSFDKVSINKGLPNSTDNVHSFDIKLSDKEFIKVIDFAITYKQTPSIIRKIEDSKITYAENSVTVNRVFTGRFYILRADAVNEPEKIIVKAVIENADNTANNVETKVLDVKSMKNNDTVKYSDDIGPEFDLYFQVRSNDLITICIGNIIPYKWVMQKDSYITDRADESKFANLIIGNINKKFIDIYYSTVINGYLLRTEDELYYTTNNNFTEDSLIKITKINYTNKDFWAKDVGSLLFIHDGNDTYISSSNINNAIKSNLSGIIDIKQLSTSEIVASVNNDGLHTYNSETEDFNTTPFITINGEKSNEATIEKDEDVFNGIDFIEIDDNKLLISSTRSGKLQYFFIVLNKNTNSYGDFATVSDIVSMDITNYTLSNPTSTKVQLLNTVVGIFDLVKVNGTTVNLSSIYNFRDLKINSKSYTYEHNILLKVYDQYNDEEVSNLDNIVFDKIYDTSIGSFAVTTDNKLYCFDDKYIIKAVTTRAITKASEIEGEEDTVIGYDDDKSFIKLDNSERYENTYFSKENPYLNDVLGLYENVSGIYVIDKNGVYELTSNLTFKTKYYKENNIVNYCDDTVNNKRTVFIENNDSKTDFYEISDIIKSDADIKLRYKYTNLFTGNYTKYNNSIEKYDYDTDNGNEKLLIKFNANLYISLIDVTGSLYNTYSSDDDIIKYSNTKYTYSDINPLVTHSLEFTNNVIRDDGTVIKTSNTKDVETKEFILRTNKYGFLNYFGLTAENLNSDEISSINDKKVYKINHTSNDKDISFDDVRKQILKLIYKNNKKVYTAVGKTEYKYSNTSLNEKYPIRSFPLVTSNSFKNVTWIERVEGTNYIIGDNVLYKNENGNVSSKNVSLNLVAYTPTNTTNCSIKGIKQTTAGTFVWATEGIILWDFTKITTFTNQLTGYSKSTDGNIIDVVDCKDSRQTILIICDKAIYVVNCRPQAASKFAKPFSASANIHKLSYDNIPPNAVMNRAFVLNDVIYITSYNTSYVLKMSYNDDNSIVLETLIANDTFKNLDSNCRGICTIRYNDKNLVIQDNCGSLFRYDLASDQISVIYKETKTTNYVYQCCVEDENYLYYTNNGLYRLSKSDYTLESMDYDFKGMLFQFYKGRVYAINNIDGADEYTNYPLITAIDLKENKYLPISDSRNPNKGKCISYGLIRQHKMINGNDKSIWFATVNPFDSADIWRLNQVFDMEHSYHNYEPDEINLQNTRGIKKLNGSYWYIGVESNNNTSAFTGDLGIYNNPNNKVADATYVEEVYNKTSDSTPNSSKTYYTLTGNFSEVFNISTFNTNTRYYKQNDNYLYVEVDKSAIPTPKRGVEYFVKNLDGAYVSCGYSFTKFSSNLTYYTRYYSYKLATENTPAENTRYFVCPNPVYTKCENLTAFTSGTDYYEKSSTTYTYNTLAEQIFSCKNEYLIYVLSTSDSSRYLTFAYNINTKTKIILPFRIDRLWDANIGVFVRYYKSSGVQNIGCLTDDLTTLVYDLDSSNITDGYGDLVEIKSEETKTVDDDQDIFICGKFGVTGKIFRYSPKDTDKFNKFHEVLTNSLGYQRLFNVDNSVYCIETDSTLKIYKYDSESNKFVRDYTGREFNLCDVTYKIDEIGKKDIYIIGSGDYNIYKSYNNTFKPVMTWWNKTIGRTTSVETVRDRIYLEGFCGSSLSDGNPTTFTKVISNNSDEEFEFTNNGGVYYFRLPSYTDWYEDGDGNRYFIYRHICSFNLDDRKVGNPCYCNGTISTTVPSKYVLTDESNNEDVNGSHVLDAKINCVPINSYDNSHLIYSCYDTDINTLLPVGDLQHLYDSDGVTIRYEYPKFVPNNVGEQVFVDSEYGTFGIHGDEVYLRKRYTENNARWTLIGTLKNTNSKFKTIIKTNILGWILVDDNSVTKFNPETNKFDIEVTMATWTNNSTTNGAKINFVKEFTDLNILFIGYEEYSKEFHKGIMRPFCLQYYCLVNNKYQFKNVDGINENWPCVGVYETSKGVFAVLEKIPTGTTIKNMSKDDYTNYENVVYHLTCGENYCTGNKVSFMESAPTNYTWTNVSGTLKPLDHNQIFEDKLGNVYLAGQTFRRNDTTYTNQKIQGYKLISVSKEDPTDLLFIPLNTNTPSYYTKDFDPSVFTDRWSTGNYSDYNYHFFDNNTCFWTRNHKSDPYDITTGNGSYGWRDDNWVGPNTITKGTDTCNDIADGINANILPVVKDGNGGIAKMFKFDDKYYILNMNTIQAKPTYMIGTLSSINPPNKTVNFVANSEMVSNVKNMTQTSINNYIDYEKAQIDWQLTLFKGQFFAKMFNRVYMFNSYKLTGIEKSSNIVDNDVLYELKLTVDNKSLYNNLSEKTVNSDIDKFVLKETGVVDLSSYTLDSDTNEIKLSGVNKNNINQYILPHNFYNVNSNNDYKEYTTNKSIGNKILNIFKPKLKDNLLRNRYLNKENNSLVDSNYHHTDTILGDIDNYIKDLSIFKIDLMIYPNSVINTYKQESELM